MRSKIAIPAVALALAVATFAGVYLIHNLPLYRRGHALSDPVAASALSVRARTPGEDLSAVAVVEYATPAGRVRETLPRGGHSLNYYTPPVRLVYDRSDPARVMLADDWRQVNTTGATVRIWSAGIATLLALLSLLGVGVLALRNNRSAPLRTRPSPGPRSSSSSGPASGPWLTDDPDYAVLAAEQSGSRPHPSP